MSRTRMARMSVYFPLTCVIWLTGSAALARDAHSARAAVERAVPVSNWSIASPTAGTKDPFASPSGRAATRQARDAGQAAPMSGRLPPSPPPSTTGMRVPGRRRRAAPRARRMRPPSATGTRAPGRRQRPAPRVPPTRPPFTSGIRPRRLRPRKPLPPSRAPWKSRPRARDESVRIAIFELQGCNCGTSDRPEDPSIPSRTRRRRFCQKEDARRPPCL